MTDQLDRLKSALADRYTIEREIGSGGMATVYLAQDLKHGRQVAIKVLRPDLAATLGPERFLREIEIAARLQHPHILPLLDSGSVEDRTAGPLDRPAAFLYYVMPYIEGQSLRERLAKEGELPVGDAVRVLRDVVDALTAAHAHGVVHRDIKPENILLSGRHALVTDFGVAKAVSEATGREQLTTAGVALGTPAYMAPEQASADPHLDHRVDIYAVGAVAYELLTGRPVFMGTTPQQVLSAHVTEAPQPVTKHRETVPTALESVVLRCLEKKPADRFQTAEELLPQLEALATPSGGMTPTDTRPVSAAAPGSRRLGVGIASAAVVVTVVAAAVWIARPQSNVIPSASRIAVLPFSPAVPDTTLTRLGRELMVLLSANLDGVGSMTTVDASALLARIGSDETPLALEQGAALGRTFGAASALSGSLVRAGTGIRVEAALVSTEDLEPVARISVVASADDVGALADSLTWAFLAQVWCGREAPTPFLASHMTESFEALRAFLEGEQAFLEGRYLSAADAYGRAIAADSTLWLAYWRLRKANGWVMRGTPDRIVEAYWEHRNELPERDRLLVEAERAWPRSRRSAMRQEVTRRYPDYSPAWWDYADFLAHVGGFFGHVAEEAVAGLERVAELSPASASVWDHLGWFAVLLGDSAGSVRALDALARLGAERTLREGYGWNIVGYLQIAHRIQFEGAAVTPALVETAMALVDDTDETISFIRPWTSWFFVPVSPLLQLELNRQLLVRGVAGEQAAQCRRGQALSWMVRGAWDSAFVALDRHLANDAPPRGQVEAYRLAVLGAWLGAVEPEGAMGRRDAARQEATDPSDHAELAWLDGVLAVAQRDAAALGAARGRLLELEAPSGHDLERSLAAFEAELSGNPGLAAERMLAAVEATGDSAMEQRYAAFDAVTRLAASQWLLAEGDAARALPPLYWAEAWYTGIAVAEVATVTKGIVALQRARVEERLGRRVDAVRYYEEFLRLYDMPSERHRHLIAEAEAALARLSGVEEAVQQ